MEESGRCPPNPPNPLPILNGTEVGHISQYSLQLVTCQVLVSGSWALSSLQAWSIKPLKASSTLPLPLHVGQTQRLLRWSQGS